MKNKLLGIIIDDEFLIECINYKVKVIIEGIEVITEDKKNRLKPHLFNHNTDIKELNSNDSIFVIRKYFKVKYTKLKNLIHLDVVVSHYDDVSNEPITNLLKRELKYRKQLRDGTNNKE